MKKKKFMELNFSEKEIKKLSELYSKPIIRHKVVDNKFEVEIIGEDFNYFKTFPSYHELFLVTDFIEEVLIKFKERLASAYFQDNYINIKCPSKLTQKFNLGKHTEVQQRICVCGCKKFEVFQYSCSTAIQCINCKSEFVIYNS